MRKFKIFMALFLALTCLTTLVPPVFANDAYALNVIGETKSVSRGDTITYEIRASQKGRIYPASIRLTWEYDSSVFTLVDAKLGNLYYDQFEKAFPCTITDDSYEGFIYSEANEGVIVTLTFKVEKKCPTATYPITIHAEYYNDDRITTNPFFPVYEDIASKYNCYSVTSENGALSINDHVYSAWTSMGADTHQRECTLCHDFQAEPHVWDNGVIQKQPTSVSEGLKVYTCIFCEETKEETLPKTTDQLDEETIRAYALNVVAETRSTSKDDTITYTIRASQKGRIYPASIHLTWEYDTSVFTLVDKKIGDLFYEQFEEFFPATLTDDSYEGFIYSETKEGTLVTLTFKVAKECSAATYPITIHAEYYNDERITENPFFHMYPEISSKYNCYTVKSENGAISVNDHIYTAWTSMGADMHQRECTLCHDFQSAPHAWDQGVIKKAASCISDGLKVYTCTDCGEIRNEILPKTADHVYGDWTYTGDAEKHQRSCECGDTQYEEHVLGNNQKHDSKNHKRICECGYEQYSAHSFGSYRKHDAENHKQSCVCGEELFSTHTWDTGKVTKPAQHLEEGIRTYTCTACKETKTETIPKTTTHNYGMWEKHDVNEHKRSCKCGEWDYAEHEWDAGTVKKPATNKEDGLYSYTCEVCGETKDEVIPRFEGSLGLAFRENDDGTYSVSGIGTCTDTHIVIPTATPDGAKVTGIRRNAFKDNTTITSVTVPVGIKTIEKWAFRYCKNLKTVTLSGGLTEIGEAAFQGCTALTSVTISSGITEIPESLFAGCTSLTNVTLPNGILTIGASAFSRCTALTTIKLPATLTTLGDSAFFNCLKLTSVSVPAGVTVIDKNTFYGCIALKTVTLSDGLREIGTSAFQGCTALTIITIPDTVTTIGDSAFYGCEDIQTLTFGNGLITIGTSAFESCEKLTSVVLPDTLETLGSSAFAYCANLKNIRISETLKTLGSSCFAGCRRLTRVILPKTMTSVGTNVWTGCNDLAEVYYLGTPAELTAMAITLPESAKIYYYAEVKPEIADGNDYWHYENGEIVIWVLYLRGDLNGDGVKNAADAMYLLRHTVMSIMYPINQPGDLNGDGSTNAADAMYLLRHTVMPSLYPLK